jgi:glucose-1-phosphate thymidylyltransferase
MGKIEQAVILAAGEGQRLRPFTALKPKVMIPIANRPILQYVVEALAVNGVRHIVMVVGYRKEQVQDYFGSGEQFGVKIDYVTQRQQLGTAHALKQAQESAEERFLVLSGDNIIEPDTIAQFVKAEPTALLIKEQENVSKYGVVVTKGGIVQEVVEKPREAPSNLINTGIYTFDRGVFEFIGEELDLTTVLQKMIAEKHPLVAHETRGQWLDVVYPWDILRLNDVALNQISLTIRGTVERGVSIKGPVSIGKDSVVRSNTYIVGPALIGENCEIGPSVCILPSTTIGDNVIVCPFTQLKNSVIGSNVYLGSGSTLEDSILDSGTFVEGHFIASSAEAKVEVDEEYHRVRIGAMLGEYCYLESNVVVRPGIIVGNHCRVKALKIVGENLPDGSLVM